MTTREDLEQAMPHAQEEISRCLELSRHPGSDTEYWLRRMDDRLDMYIMGRDQLRCIDALADA